MSKRILAACLAALSVAACDQPKVAAVSETHGRSPSPLRTRSREEPVTSASMGSPSVGTPSVGATSVGGTSVGATSLGTITGPLPSPGLPAGSDDLDPLSLPHDSPTVDHLARAGELSQEGDVKAAVAEARRALFSAPQDGETLVVLARLAHRARQYAVADEAWGRLAALSGADATPLIQQARARLGLRDYEGAVAAAGAARLRDEGNPEAYQVAGLAQLGQGDLAGAIESFEKVVAIAPNHGWALNNLGLAYLRSNEDERALESLERAAALLPDVATVHNNLGVALRRLGAIDEAREAFRRAMDLSPRYVKARVNAARLARLTEDPGDAADDLPLDAHPLPAAP